MTRKRSVRILGFSKKHDHVIVKLFTKAGYQILKNKKQRASIGIVGIRSTESNGTTVLLKEVNSEYPLIWLEVAPDANLMASYYSHGAYRCLFLPKFGKIQRLAAALVRTADDTIALARLMGSDIFDSTGWGRMFLDRLDVGVSVLDRGFRIWYRNKKHLDMVSANRECPLCWVAYHNLKGKTEPCMSCPSAELFRSGKVLKEAVHMAVGCGQDDKRQPRLTRVRAVPLVDAARKGRIVGAVELVYDVMSDVFERGEPNFDLAIQGLLRSSFLQHFTRARLFILSSDGKELVGHTSVVRKLVPPLGCPIRSMRIKAVPPVGQSDEPNGGSPQNSWTTVPEMPQVRHIQLMHRSELAYYEELDKDHAPTWAELPVRNSDNKIVGKIVVDRWSRDSEMHPIELNEVDGYGHALTLLGRLIVEARDFNTARDSQNVATGVADIINAQNQQETLKTLCSAVGRLSGVVSAIVRAPVRRKGTVELVRVGGWGAYSRHCQEHIGLLDTIAGAAFRNRTRSKILTTDTLKRLVSVIEKIKSSEDRAELKRIRFQGSFAIGPADMEPTYVLSVQCEDSKCLADGSIVILVSAANAALTVGLQQDFGDDLLKCLLTLLELHDRHVAEHSRRVGKIAQAIAKHVPGISLQKAYYAGCLHDIGQLGIDRNILRQRVPFNDGERTYAGEHIAFGQRVLGAFRQLQDISKAAAEHHMWFNGAGGYPKPATGVRENDWKKNISPLGQIVALADCYEAMTSVARDYQPKTTPDNAMINIVNLSGKRFSPVAVTAFREAFTDILLELQKDVDSDSNQRTPNGVSVRNE